MLVPKKVKFPKQFRGTIGRISRRGISLDFGEYGLKSQGKGWITSRQIEAARRAITHYTKRGGRIWIRIFPDKAITKKAAESGMGGGKGDVVEYVAVIKPGRILFEMGGVEAQIAKEAMRLAAHKLPVKTKFVTRERL